MNRASADWNPREDGRPAESWLKPAETTTGERYWVLGVQLYAGREWPVDCYARIFVWQERNDGVIRMQPGRYWPVATAQGDGDDGA